jgi:hypothetical protein
VPKLTLVRDHPSDIRHRYAIMALDGKEVARMKFKDRVELEVQPGRHTLEGKNELGKASTVELEVQSDLTVHIGGIPIGCFSIIAGVLPPTPEIVMSVGKPWEGKPKGDWK